MPTRSKTRAWSIRTRSSSVSDTRGQCRLKQCCKCQFYGHIGIKCKATIACGYRAQEHESRLCSLKLDQTVPRKSATCRGDHEAWIYQCPNRKEKAKARVAYNGRPYYHPIAQTLDSSVPLGTSFSMSRRSRMTQIPSSKHAMPITRNRSQIGRLVNKQIDQAAPG